MPSINLETLAHLGVKEAADIQQPAGSSECGAYAIAGAVGAFDNFLEGPISYSNEGPEVVDKHGELTRKQSFQEKCATIYYVTGILNPKMRPELVPGGKDMGNSPAAMAQVVHQLGMDLPRIYAQPAALAALKQAYPGEEARCVEVVSEKNVERNAPAYSAPEPGSQRTQVVLVARQKTDPPVWHWLAQGDDGRFYDPANGSTDNTWTPKQFGDLMGDDFIFLGLWMVLREPAAG